MLRFEEQIAIFEERLELLRTAHLKTLEFTPRRMYQRLNVRRPTVTHYTCASLNDEEIIGHSGVPIKTHLEVIDDTPLGMAGYEAAEAQLTAEHIAHVECEKAYIEEHIGRLHCQLEHHMAYLAD